MIDSTQGHWVHWRVCPWCAHWLLLRHGTDCPTLVPRMMAAARKSELEAFRISGNSVEPS